MKKILLFSVIVSFIVPLVGLAAVANRHPIISRLSYPAFVQPGQTGNFTIKTWEPNGENYSLLVNWGDNTFSSTTIRGTSTLANTTTRFKKAYTAPGTYQTIFQIIDASGKKAETLASITVGSTTPSSTITIANRHPLIINFSGPDKTVKNKKITYKLKSSEPNGEPYHYQVTWGDGVFSTGTIYTSSTTSMTSSLTHSYKNTGSYDPVIKVWDNKSANAETGMRVSVSEIKPTSSSTPTSTPTSTLQSASLLELLQEQIDSLFGSVADIINQLAEKSEQE